MTVALSTDLQPYRVAAAELPQSVRIAGDPSGAVVAIGGERWTDAAERAIRAGAAAVVVRRPEAARADDIARLAGLGIPIVLDRPLVRSDAVLAMRVVLDGARPFATAVVECHAPTRSLRGAVRDAVAWTRVLLGQDVRVASSSTGSFADVRGLALLETSEGVSVSLLAAATPGAPPLGRVRATGLGETRVEFDGDEHQQWIEVSDAASHRLLPRLFETPERVALRRAAAALAGGEATRDLAEFAHDDALASALTTVLAA